MQWPYLLPHLVFDNITILIGKINKFDHRFDFTLFYGDFCKFLSCVGLTGKRGIG